MDFKAGCFHRDELVTRSASPLSCSYRIAEEADPCENLPQAQCKPPQCVWCKSAAVPSACFTKEQAQRLPPGVFQCDAS